MLLFYSNKSSPRIEYICNTLFPAMGIEAFQLTTDSNLFFNHSGARINYSPAIITNNEIWIKPVCLLFEDNIQPQTIEVFSIKDNVAFYKSEGHFTFDVFAASFYLISRHEEYLPHKLDMYGRYAHENSLAFQNKFLHLPLVNIWLHQLKKILQHKFSNLLFAPASFQFIPTYDIDIAWSYLNKGLVRNAGGLLKSIINGELKDAKDRLEVLIHDKPDPFDVYEWLDELHAAIKLKPLYFFLLAKENKDYDKNILPGRIKLQELIKKHAYKYEIGIHPSWQSGENDLLLKQEIELLELISKKKITKSRQHYIRMTLPATYRKLIEAGISEDYSMGYGSINGFRASYCLPFKWFDLEENKATELTILPFCFMEANSLFEQHYSADEALDELKEYYYQVQKVDGLLITIFHNHLITKQAKQLPWRMMYEKFLQEITSA